MYLHILKKIVNNKRNFLIITRANSKIVNFKNNFIIKHRLELFENEKERQLKEIERTEKIEVKVKDYQSNKTILIMNKYLSTPYHCAMHFSERACKNSVLAQVDNKIWDMHRPLETSCELSFLNFLDQNPIHVNNAFWRSCSFILGYILEVVFKDEFFIELCSFPPPDIKSGSFVYDAKLNIPGWLPTKEELRCLSIAASRIISKNLKFERIQIKPELALEMFKYNRFKLEQIPSILEKNKQLNNQNLITVYRLGEYVDISKGPMISCTDLIGRFEITGIFNIDSSKYGQIQRLQGVAIPSQLKLHNWTFNLLVDRASKLNSTSNFNQ